MKPARFNYHRPENLHRAADLMIELGEDAYLLAGGQSLLPAMILRVSRPTDLVDISRLAELRRIEVLDDSIVIGAATTHNEIRNSEELAASMPVFRSAAGWIAHHSIREKGTFGGSLANADPASEWPCIAVALSAEVHIFHADGRRSMPAAEFFLAPLTSALEPGEIITHVSFPRDSADIIAFDEVAPQRGAFGLALAASRTRFDDDRLSALRICVGGCGGTPEVVISGDQEFLGRRLNDNLAFAIAQHVHDKLEPDGDKYISSADRKQIAKGLVLRMLRQLGGSGAGR